MLSINCNRKIQRLREPKLRIKINNNPVLRKGWKWWLSLIPILIISSFVLPTTVPAFAQSEIENNPNIIIENAVKSKTASTVDIGYILDRNIKWADGITEHIQIDNDRFVIIDGIKKNLIGIVLATVDMPYKVASNDGVEFYLPENLAIYDKKLTYLASVGIRLVSVDLRYIRWYTPNHSIKEEEEGHKAFLDLINKHKMLVIAQTNAKWMPNFDNLSNPDFSWKIGDGTDSWGAFLKRWSNILAAYPNVIAVSADNELDYPLGADDYPGKSNFKGQNYGPTEVTNYLNFYKDIIGNMNVPVIHKLMTYMDRPDIKTASLKATDFPAFNVYGRSARDLTGKLNTLISWLEEGGFPTTGWWCMELNNGWPNTVLSNFNTNYIENVFTHGARIALLYTSAGAQEYSFFAANGEPVSKLREIAKEIPRLQTPQTNMVIANNR